MVPFTSSADLPHHFPHHLALSPLTFCLPLSIALSAEVWLRLVSPGSIINHSPLHLNPSLSNQSRQIVLLAEWYYCSSSLVFTRCSLLKISSVFFFSVWDDPWFFSLCFSKISSCAPPLTLSTFTYVCNTLPAASPSHRPPSWPLNWHSVCSFLNLSINHLRRSRSCPPFLSSNFNSQHYI